MTILSMMALQAPLDRARGELSLDTYISSWKILCREIGEIWRSEITTRTMGMRNITKIVGGRG